MEQILFQKGLVQLAGTVLMLGKLHTKKLNNLIYFPYSSVKLLSATAFTEYIKDDEVTWVLTKMKYSIFTWYFGKYKNTIARSEIFLPVLDVQAGFSKFSGFNNRVVSISIDSTFDFDLVSICTREVPITDKLMGFTPEVED